MFKTLRSRLGRAMATVAGALASVGVASSASAASVLPIDASTLTADLLTDISTIGPVIIAVAAAVMGLRWIKAMFF